MNRYSLLLAVALIAIFASPAAASDVSRYWTGFKTFWGGLFGSVSGVVGLALLTGIVGIFIITRGKWLK